MQEEKEAPGKRFRRQLHNLRDMGFTNRLVNIRALALSRGDETGAIQMLLGDDEKETPAPSVSGDGVGDAIGALPQPYPYHRSDIRSQKMETQYLPLDKEGPKDQARIRMVCARKLVSQQEQCQPQDYATAINGSDHGSYVYHEQQVLDQREQLRMLYSQGTGEDRARMMHYQEWASRQEQYRPPGYNTTEGSNHVRDVYYEQQVLDQREQLRMLPSHYQSRLVHSRDGSRMNQEPSAIATRAEQDESAHSMRENHNIASTSTADVAHEGDDWRPNDNDTSEARSTDQCALADIEGGDCEEASHVDADEGGKKPVSAASVGGAREGNIPTSMQPHHRSDSLNQQESLSEVRLKYHARIRYAQKWVSQQQQKQHKPQGSGTTKGSNHGRDVYHGHIKQVIKQQLKTLHSQSRLIQSGDGGKMHQVPSAAAAREKQDECAPSARENHSITNAFVADVANDGGGFRAKHNDASKERNADGYSPTEEGDCQNMPQVAAEEGTKVSASSASTGGAGEGSSTALMQPHNLCGIRNQHMGMQWLPLSEEYQGDHRNMMQAQARASQQEQYQPRGCDAIEGSNHGRRVYYDHRQNMLKQKQQLKMLHSHYQSRRIQSGDGSRMNQVPWATSARDKNDESAPSMRENHSITNTSIAGVANDGDDWRSNDNDASEARNNDKYSEADDEGGDCQEAAHVAANNFKQHAALFDTSTVFNIKRSFPLKLTQMLESVRSKGLSHIVRWTANEKGFEICDSDLFWKDVVPQFFDGNKRIRSFHRRLNRWGFTKNRKNVWHHPEFNRGCALEKLNQALEMGKIRSLGTLLPHKG